MSYYIRPDLAGNRLILSFHAILDTYPMYLLYMFSIITTLIGIDGCPQEAEKIKEIIFTTGSRAFQEKVSITDKQMIISRKNALNGTDQTSEHSISKMQWKNLLSTLPNEPLAALENLPAPTMERARDAANSSYLRIITDQKTYNSGSFDNHNPHHKLKPLMKAILNLNN